MLEAIIIITKSDVTQVNGCEGGKCLSQRNQHESRRSSSRPATRFNVLHLRFVGGRSFHWHGRQASSWDGFDSQSSCAES